MVKMACPAVFLHVVQGKLGRQDQQCDLWREAAIERIAEIRTHAVIVATSTQYPPVSLREWFEGTRMLAQRLTSSGVQTLFMRDTPHAPFSVPECLARAAWRGSGDCNLRRSQTLEQTVFGIEQTVAQSLPHVWNIDLSDRICGPEQCEVVQDGRIILRDRDHLSASYVENLAPALAARIVPLISANGPAGKVRSCKRRPPERHGQPRHAPPAFPRPSRAQSCVLQSLRPALTAGEEAFLSAAITRSAGRP